MVVGQIYLVAEICRTLEMTISVNTSSIINLELPVPPVLYFMIIYSLWLSRLLSSCQKAWNSAHVTAFFFFASRKLCITSRKVNTVSTGIQLMLLPFPIPFLSNLLEQNNFRSNNWFLMKLTFVIIFTGICHTMSLMDLFQRALAIWHRCWYCEWISYACCSVLDWHFKFVISFL